MFTLFFGDLFWYILVPAACLLFVVRVIFPVVLRFLPPDIAIATFMGDMVVMSSDFLGWLRGLLMNRTRPEAPSAAATPAAASATAPAAPLPAPPATLPPPETGAPAGAPSAGAAQSDLLYAIDALVAEASSGDIKAVRRVVATFALTAQGMGGALARLGQRLSEPDKDYGPEIYERVLGPGSQFRAGGMQLAEADASLLSLLGRTVGELADSPQRAPHSSQLNGGN